jgi:hypothetical protein
MLTRSMIAVALSAPVIAAQAQCVLQERTVSRQDRTIQERSDIRRHVVPDPQGGRKCVVDFRVRIGDQWHQAQGEYQWDGARPHGEACAAAVALAERDVQARVNSRATVSENVLVCNDDPDRERLTQQNPGTVAQLSQYRPHPDYPKPFYHNGTQCRWFLETGYQNRDVRAYSGVICQLQDQKWIVVDRF